MNSQHKIWGLKSRIFENDKVEVDILYLKKDHACSQHWHSDKNNRFYVIQGEVEIQTEYGYSILEPNDIFDVKPLLMHRFIALEDSILLEIAYINDGKINPDDIHRELQGGKFVDDIFTTEDELREKGWLNIQ